MSLLSFFLPLRDRLRDDPRWKTLSDVDEEADGGSGRHLRFWGRFDESEFSIQ
jgi:hypothetical protein